MIRRLTIGMLGAAIAAGLLTAPAASASVEFGSNCTGNDTAPGEYTLTTLAAPGPLPVTAPSSGIITKLTVRMEPFPALIPTSIRVLRPAGGNAYTVVGETTVNVGSGLTLADARLPVQAGDRLGLHGQPFTFEGSPVPSLSVYCEDIGIGSILGAALGDVKTGATAEFGPATEGRIPVSAVIEPDADGDGYGDETQDKCPQSAATQLECPTITIDSLNLSGKNSVTVLVTTSASAPVKVTGSVSLGKGKKATLKGGKKTVAAGKFVRFKLKFSSSLKKLLTELDPSQKLTLKITASATNVAGQVSTDKSKVKLRGQG